MTTNEQPKVLYRYTRSTSSSAGIDSGEYYGNNSMIFYNYNISLQQYKILSETDKGYWIQLHSWDNTKKKWVSKTAKKRFAYPTKEQALLNFKKRTESAVKILTSQLETAKNYLIEANNFKIDEEKQMKLI